MARDATVDNTLDVVDPLWQRVLNERFTILEPIGSGGMGKVYRAVQAPLGRVVALKVLNPKYANGKDPEFRRRFFLEASLTARLRHPNTITVIDYGETRDGIFYIVMEYLEGQTLSQVLARSGPLPWMRCLNIAQQVCRSLREAHKLGVVHRDLKPANVMLLSEDQEMDLVKVLDFGLVKSFVSEDGSFRLQKGSGSEQAKDDNPEVTLGGMFVGSPQYMAPEQARNQADHRSDIYALGTTVYHMMTGRPPFVGKDALEVIFKQINEPPPSLRSLRPDLDIPAETEAVLMRCLEKHPSHRFQSMDEVLEAIRRAAMIAGGAGFLSGAGAMSQLGTAVTPPPMLTFESPPPLPQPAEPALKETTLALDISVVPSWAPRPPTSDRKLSWLLEQAWAVRQVWPLVVGSMGVLTLVLVLGMLLIRRSEKPSLAARPLNSKEPTIFVAKPPPPEASASADVSERVQAPKRVRFRVSSDPSGATVSMGGEFLGTTPFTFDRTPNAEGNATAKLLFRMRGYQPIIVTTGGSGEIVLSERLEKLRSSGRGGGLSERTETPVERPATIVSRSDTQKSLEPTGSVTPESNSSLSVGTPSAAPALAVDQAQVMPSAPAVSPSAPVASRIDPVPVEASNPVPAGPVEFNERTMTAPVKVSGPDPEYTQRALDRDVQGQMVVRCIVSKDGRVRDCRVLRGLPFMNDAVVSTLERRTYRPALLRGTPVEVYYTFKVTLNPPR